VGEFVTVTTDDEGVATVRLDRPPVNALNPQMWSELGEVARVCAEDDAIGAVVLWGGEKVFAAGADIKAMRAMSYAEMAARGPILQEALRSIAQLPKVVIAAVTGYALGAGCELALTADFRYAADNAKLGQPEILLGVIPGAGGTQRLTRIVGVQKAKEMVYGGGFYSAAECHAMGLVDKVCAPEEVYATAVADARRYAKGPFALRLAKQAIDTGIEMDLDAALRLETTLFAACFATEDQRIGMDSFVEHGPGKAEFTGR
jgi:enoyl-CoA hydratase/carnithine racemase